MDVQERLTVGCCNLELNRASAPDVLGITDIKSLSNLDFLTWKIDSVLLLPEPVHLQAVLPPLVLINLTLLGVAALAKRHRTHCVVDHLVLSKTLLPDIFPTDRADLLGHHCFRLPSSAGGTLRGTSYRRCVRRSQHGSR